MKKTKPKKCPMSVFVMAEHWEILLQHHLEEGREAYHSSQEWEEAEDASAGAIWINEIGADLEARLERAWKKLAPGGFLGGPSWGVGMLRDGRFAVDTRSKIERFCGELDDVSERFLGYDEHPCWMVFKRKKKSEEKVLLISGCDQLQMTFFGELAQKNHKHYAAHHGYETRWHLWDPLVWGSSRLDLVWAKLKVVADALAEGIWDQVWWIDADAVFLKMDRKIAHFLHPSWDGVFAEFVHEGRAMLSTGVFGSRPNASPLLNHVWENGKRGGYHNEESALSDAIEERPDLWSHIQAFDHRLFNGIYSWHNHFSDPARAFTCHMVGCSNRKRRHVFRQINRNLGI